MWTLTTFDDPKDVVVTCQTRLNSLKSSFFKNNSFNVKPPRILLLADRDDDAE
jgi:hypothetical protein